MRYARDEDLDQLEPLLKKIRALGALKEKKRGTFYLKSKGFLHFHQDPAGFFADVRTPDGGDYERLKLDAAGQRALLARITAVKS